VTPALIESARTAKLQINIWTVNNPDEISRFRSLGADGIFTDFPDRCSMRPS
jgi:glycerophosphoryl diester phosphodiesterase